MCVVGGQKVKGGEGGGQRGEGEQKFKGERRRDKKSKGRGENLKCYVCK